MPIHNNKPSASGAARDGLAAALAVVAIAFASLAHGADMTVAKDPVTGELRAPTAEESKALEEQQAKDTAARAPAGAPAPLPRSTANGAVGYNVGDAFMSYSVVSRNADGTTTLHCVSDAAAADKLVNSPQASSVAADQEHSDEQ